MQKAQLFTNGRSQAVRLPKECRFEGKDVYVHKLEGAVMLIAKDDPWAALANSLEKFTEDFMTERLQPTQEERKSLR